MKYYVYAYLREDGSPYYVGKGSGHRAWVNDKIVNKPNDPERIKLWDENLTEAEAFSKEKEYIALYGRKDVGTSILRYIGAQCDVEI